MGSDFSQYYQEQARQAAFNNAMEFQRQQSARQAEQARYIDANRQMYADQERQRQQQTMWRPRTAGPTYTSSGSTKRNIPKRLAILAVVAGLMIGGIVVAANMPNQTVSANPAPAAQYGRRWTVHRYRHHHHYHHHRR